MNPRVHSNLRIGGALLLAFAALVSVALASKSRAPAKPSPRVAATAPHASASASHTTAPAPAPATTRATAVAPGTAPAPARATTPAPGTAGMVVGIDESGQLGMPTPKQVQELGLREDPSVSRSTAGIPEIHLANGAVGLDLQGRFRDYATVTIGPDGRRTFGCMHDNGNMPNGPDSIPPAGLEVK